MGEMLPSPNNLMAPLRAIGKALASHGIARDHPLSRDLRTFLANGYEVTDFTLTPEPPHVAITLRANLDGREGDVRQINSDDLAFVAYAATAVPREQSRARLRSEQNDLIKTEGCK